MKPLGSRSWKLKGKLRVLTFLLFLFSVLFITYQLISYVTITNYQAEEAHALQELKQKHKSERYEYSLGSLKPVGRTHDPENLAKYFRKPVVVPVLGAAPSSWKFYVKPGVSLSLGDDAAEGSYFMCIHSGHQIAWEKVNDDYCDCPDDGSDEPSTNACLNGTFYCTRSIAKYPEHVPSSRVNDHVCDCCDGSDEILANCKKHC